MPAEDQVVVVGAGQSGLATGYHLQQRGVPHTILADDDRVGDTWRERWDSLELFTPGFYNGLPGLAFPADDPEHLPSGEEMADYLESYAERFALPVELGTRVTRLAKPDDRFRLETTDGERVADIVVVCTGAHSSPNVPEFADELDDEVVSCHSSEYDNPDQLHDGSALLVGAGNSGTQIATELAEAGREVWLVGPDTGTLPRRLLGRDVYRWIGPTLLRIPRSSFIGRRLYDRIGTSGDPVFADTAERFERSGAERVESRITGVEDGAPVAGDGRSFPADTVVWATGFRPRFPWVDLDVFEPGGEPRHEGGVATDVPGLYFVGLPWQRRPDSSLVGGVGDDAAHVARKVQAAR